MKYYAPGQLLISSAISFHMPALESNTGQSAVSELCSHSVDASQMTRASSWRLWGAWERASSDSRGRGPRIATGFLSHVRESWPGHNPHAIDPNGGSKDSTSIHQVRNRKSRLFLFHAPRTIQGGLDADAIAVATSAGLLADGRPQSA